MKSQILEHFSTKEYVSYKKDISFAYNKWYNLTCLQFQCYATLVKHLTWNKDYKDARKLMFSTYIKSKEFYNLIIIYWIISMYWNKNMYQRLIFYIFISEIWIFETLSFSCWMWFVMARKLLIDMIELRRTHMQKYLKLFRIWEGTH